MWQEISSLAACCVLVVYASKIMILSEQYGKKSCSETGVSIMSAPFAPKPLVHMKSQTPCANRWLLLFEINLVGFHRALPSTHCSPPRGARTCLGTAKLPKQTCIALSLHSSQRQVSMCKCWARSSVKYASRHVGFKEVPLNQPKHRIVKHSLQQC